jgi:hypothetical protein
MPETFAPGTMWCGAAYSREDAIGARSVAWSRQGRLLDLASGHQLGADGVLEFEPDEVLTDVTVDVGSRDDLLEDLHDVRRGRGDRLDGLEQPTVVVFSRLPFDLFDQGSTV